jgi:phosphate transport system permease protein
MAAERRSSVLDMLGAVLAWSVAVVVVLVLLFIVGDVASQGARAISWSFIVGFPEDAGRSGGVAPILVSTLLILIVCFAVTLPVGLGAALFLSELTPIDGRFGVVVRRSLDVLAGVPSVVFGLFGNAVFCKALGLGFSIASGGLTLACMVLPYFIRLSEESLRSLPNEYRHAAAALSLSRTTTLLRVLVPAAAPGIAIAGVLATGRALAETAALLFTSGYVDRMPESLLDSGRALSVHIYDLAMNVPGGDRNAQGSALLLVGALVVIQGLAAMSAQRWLGKGKDHDAVEL